METMAKGTTARGSLFGWLAACALLLACAGPAQAARTIPSGMLIGMVDSASYPVITLKKPKPSLLVRIAKLWLYPKTVSYSVAVSVRIRDESGRFMVHGMLPQLAGKFVGLEADVNGQVRQVWVLTRQEADEYAARPDTRFPI
ncbi:hypothetical protein D9M68_169730 [compost metagenome]